jgi:hypothetical protein
VAPASAVNVTDEDVPVTTDGETVATMPAGSPLTVRVTGPVNPPMRSTAMTLGALVVPGSTTADVGDAEMLTAGLGVTLSSRVSLLGVTPATPAVTITAEVPTAAVVEAVRVMWCASRPASVVRAKVAVTPVGSPLALSATTAFRLVSTTVIGTTVTCPCTTAAELVSSCIETDAGAVSSQAVRFSAVMAIRRRRITLPLR